MVDVQVEAPVAEINQEQKTPADSIPAFMPDIPHLDEVSEPRLSPAEERQQEEALAALREQLQTHPDGELAKAFNPQTAAPSPKENLPRPQSSEHMPVDAAAPFRAIMNFIRSLGQRFSHWMTS